MPLRGIRLAVCDADSQDPACVPGPFTELPFEAQGVFTAFDLFKGIVRTMIDFQLYDDGIVAFYVRIE